MSEFELTDSEKEYEPFNQRCAGYRRKLGLYVPPTEAGIEKIDCDDEACFVTCPNW
jgi:hypothetical protein